MVSITFVVNGLESFGTTSDEISIIAIDLQANGIEICLETLPPTSDEIRIITNNLLLNCADYELQT